MLSISEPRDDGSRVIMIVALADAYVMAAANKTPDGGSTNNT